MPLTRRQQLVNERLLRSRRAEDDRLYHFDALLLFLALLAPFAVDKYRIFPHVQDISVVSLILLSAISFVRALIRQQNIAPLLTSFMLASAFIIYSSAIFTHNTGSNFYYSISSQRWFMYWMLGPILMLLGRGRNSTRAILRTVVIAAIFSMAVFTFRQFTWPLNSMADSSDPSLRSLARHSTAFRGARLFYAQYIAYAAICLIFPLWFYEKKRGIIFSLTSIIFLMLYAIVYSRLMLIYLPVALLVSIVVLSRLPLALKVSLGCIVAASLLAAFDVKAAAMLDYVEGDQVSGIGRLGTIRTIISVLPRYYLFGLGGDNSLLTYQQIFGRKFFPSDVGLLGDLFCYGILGLVALASLHFLVIRAAVATYLCCERQQGALRAIGIAAVWCSVLYLLMAGTFINYIAPDSIVVGGFILALPSLVGSYMGDYTYVSGSSEAVRASHFGKASEGRRGQKYRRAIAERSQFGVSGGGV